MKKKTRQISLEDKKTLSVFEKQTNIEILDKKLLGLKEVADLYQNKISTLEKNIDVKQSEYDLLSNKIKTLNLHHFEEVKRRLIEDIENMKPILLDKQKSLNNLNTKLNDTTKLVNSMVKQKNTLTKEVNNLAKQDKKLDNSIKQAKINFSANMNDYASKLKCKRNELDDVILKASAILKTANETAKNIKNTAEKDAKDIILKVVENNDLLINENTKLEIDNKELKKENDILVKANEKESKKVGKELAGIKKLEEQVNKELASIQSIKENALNEIYRTAKKYKIEKINNEVKQLL